MNHVITLVLLLDAHLLVDPLPTIRRAHHLLPITVSVFSLLDLAAAVQTLFTIFTKLFSLKRALAGCVTGASVEQVTVAASPFPKCLVAAHHGICALPGGGCVFELGALVGGNPVVIAPAPQPEAVAFATIYFAGS